MSYTPVTGSQITGNRGYQIAENASPLVAAATANHWVLWASPSGLRELDDAGVSRVFVYEDATQTLTNKTLTTPTLSTPVIANFTSATHNHQNAAGGGSLDAAAIGSGTLANARINWASPSAIGTGTPAAGTFTAGTFTGLTVSTTAPEVIISGSTSQNRIIRFQTAGVNRWAIYASNTAESGSDAGSNLLIANHNDAGTAIGNAVSIFRSTGRVLLSGELEVDGALNHDGTTVGLYGVAPTVIYATTGTSTGFTAGGGTTVTHTSTFTGNTGSTAYTIGDIVRALKLIGAMTA
jgi:hypothetical protein